MATIKVHAGDFLPRKGSYNFGQLSLPTEDHAIMGEAIAATELSEVEIATEESVKRFGGTVGWGVAGGVVFGPLGAIAGLVFGGRGKDVTFVAKFKDGRRLMATTDSKTFKKLKAITF